MKAVQSLTGYIAMSLVTEASDHSSVRSAVPTVPVWRLSVSQYHEMIRDGILGEDDPVELLDGLLVPKMTKTPPHRVATKLVSEALSRAVPEGWYVDSQEPITLRESEPEPDVVVVRGDTRRYSDRHPGPADLALVVEIAESSLDRDQKLKKRIYAEAGIPVYWILNLVERRLEVCSEPSGTGERADYRHRRDFGPEDAVSLVVEGREVGTIAVGTLLP
jgi:Uma2 family endonuclease